MTFREIYDRTCFKLWGSSPAPAGATHLTGEYGFIANNHFKVQQDYNYWFMETSTTIAVTDGTETYALPTNYKELIKGGLRFTDADSGDYHAPLSPVYPGEYQNWTDADLEVEYPEFYEIFDDQLVLYPTPSQDLTLNVRYYKYFDRPTATDFVEGATTYDDVTRSLHEVLCAMSAADMAKVEKEMDLVQVFSQEAGAALGIVMGEDTKRRRPEVNQVRYRGL